VYGWIRDTPDPRDLRYVRFVGAGLKGSSPESVDLRPNDNPIYEQGELGSCQSQAAIGNAQFLEKKDGLPAFMLSRLELYYNVRVLQDTVKEDSGGSLRNCIKVLVKQGVCLEAIWPYIISKFKRRPNETAYEDGLKRVVKSYYALDGLEDMKDCLASGFPFIFGVAVYDSFLMDDVTETGIVPMPDPMIENFMGGHALMCVGFDDAKQWFIFRNSFGTEWGDHGYGYIPYEYLSNPELAADFWTIRRGGQM
jgi:C1A family cysteine protease